MNNSKRGFLFIFNYHRRRRRPADKRRICFASNNGRRAVRNKSKRIEYLRVPVTKTQSARSSITDPKRPRPAFIDPLARGCRLLYMGKRWHRVKRAMGLCRPRFVIIRKRSNGFFPKSHRLYLNPVAQNLWIGTRPTFTLDRIDFCSPRRMVGRDKKKKKKKRA